MPSGSLLLTVLMQCNSYLMLFGRGVSCRILYSIVSYLRGLLFKFVDFLYSRSELVDRVIKVI